MKEPVYYLEITADKCKVNGELNGFPCLNLTAADKSNVAMPINIALISGQNVINIITTPVSYDSVSLENANVCDVEYKIKLYENGDITGPDSGSLIKQGLINTLGTTTVTFNNEIDIQFSDFFKSLVPVDRDDEALKLFVSQIIDDIRNGNTSLLKSRFSYKLEQYAYAYYSDAQPYKEGAYEFLEYYILKNLPKDYISDLTEVLFIPYCDKKIWYVCLANNEDLIYSGPDEEGNIHFIPVYIAKLNGKMAIVR